MNNIREDNKGFSILEVLIASIVLAIIVIPMLHSFVTSHMMNAKSKQIMRATTLAQNEMEIFEKEKIEDLMDPTKFDYTVTGPEDDGSYVFERSEITNDESGASAARYDVIIKLNPERADDTGRYYETNSKELLYINTVGGLDSGSYVQPVKNSRNYHSYDENVYEWFNNNKLPTGGQEDYFKGRNDFKERLARKITVRVYQVNEGAQTNTIVKVIYDYFAPDNVMPGGFQRYTDEKVIFNNTQKKDEDGNQVELKNVYLFFSPRYDAKALPGIGDTSTITYDGELYKVTEDLIIIENEAALPVNFFVIRQDVLKEDSETVTMSVPKTYQAKIEIYDNQTAEGGLCGTYYTNLNLDEPVQDEIRNDVTGEIVQKGNGKHTWFSIYNINTSTPLYGGDPGVEYVAIGEPIKNNIHSLTGKGSKEIKDRIYSMEVKVYKHDDVHEDDERAIVTMTGTKLE